MANPVLIDCPEGQYTKVATNVVSGVIHKKSVRPLVYNQTYRETGEAAPTDLEEGVPIFRDNPEEEPITSTVPVDVYIWAVGQPGRVRADL